MGDLLADLELFETFRWLLGIICTIYAAIVTWQSLWGWLQWFSSSRETQRVGSYAAVLLLRIRLRRFGFELLQIAALIALFFYIVHWNHMVLRR